VAGSATVHAARLLLHAGTNATSAIHEAIGKSMGHLRGMLKLFQIPHMVGFKPTGVRSDSILEHNNCQESKPEYRTAAVINGVVPFSVNVVSFKSVYVKGKSRSASVWSTINCTMSACPPAIAHPKAPLAPETRISVVISPRPLIFPRAFVKLQSIPSASDSHHHRDLEIGVSKRPRNSCTIGFGVRQQPNQ
jgi:hypothetical protein